jgi:hypothetical protein
MGEAGGGAGMAGDKDLILKERATARVSKDDADTVAMFETAHRTAQALPGARLLTMREPEVWLLAPE